MKILSLDADAIHGTQLRAEKIAEDDLHLIDKLEIKSWNNCKFHKAAILGLRWLVNDDKSVIFLGVGGGSFEIPDMYDLIYKGIRMRLECGGGASGPGTRFITHRDETYDIEVHVTQMRIPAVLSHDVDTVLAVAADAFAAEFAGSSKVRKVTVVFNL